MTKETLNKAKEIEKKILQAENLRLKAQTVWNNTGLYYDLTLAGLPDTLIQDIAEIVIKHHISEREKLEKELEEL
jgi:beta-galactosidase/beta-glucuronidase